MGRLSRQRAVKQHETRQRKPDVKIGSGHPIVDFFAGYSDFDFKPSASSAQEFQRLRRSQGWTRGDLEGEDAWHAFRRALVKEFNVGFGTYATDLLAWQTLCAIVGIEGVYKMDSCEVCENALKERYFNLVDVVDAHRRGKNEPVQTFATAEELEEYTKKHAAYFPLNHRSAGAFLRRVLRKNKPPAVGSAEAQLPTEQLTEEGKANKVRPQGDRNIGKSALRQRIIEDIENLEDVEDCEDTFDSRWQVVTKKKIKGEDGQ
ncbi:hypothetical protein F4810DRAFT_707693 [Camillea tinctor]|nr:hypothetical protein F4810DRAFT_707693 [Camillea tinctor]